MSNHVGAAIVMVFASGLAYGAHPLNTDDPGTQDSGNHQIELNTDQLRQGSTHTDVGALTYTYGVMRTLDVALTLPGTFSSPSGINDVTAAMKWRFFDNDAGSYALRADWILPSGTAAKGLGNGKAGMALTGIASKVIGAWQLLGNAGATLNRYALPADHDAKRTLVWSASVAALYTINPSWKIVADTGVSQNSSRIENGAPGYILTGVIISPNPKFDIDAGIRFGIGCQACAVQVARQVGAGLTWRF